VPTSRTRKLDAQTSRNWIPSLAKQHQAKSSIKQVSDGRQLFALHSSQSWYSKYLASKDIEAAKSTLEAVALVAKDADLAEKRTARTEAARRAAERKADALERELEELKTRRGDRQDGSPTSAWTALIRPSP